jgi:hypothetical protein
MSHLRSDDGPPAPRRLSWKRYLIALGVIVVVAAGLAVPVIAGSDWRHTDYSRVAAHPPEPVTLTAERVRPRWRQSGSPITGDPVVADTVVTADPHGVAGRDPTTGRARWHYQRSNASVCATAVQDTTVVVLLADSGAGRCTELDGFDAATGRRLFYLNVDLPATTRLVPGPVVFLAYSASSDAQLTGYYLSGGNQAWTYHKDGCRIDDAASGEIGVFALLSCAGSPQNAVSVDAYSGKERWQHAMPVDGSRILSASGTAAFLSGQRIVLVSDDGGPGGTLPLPRRIEDLAAAPWAATQVGSRVVTYAGGLVLAFDPARQRLDWSAEAVGPALVAPNTVIVPTGAGFVEYRPDGRRGTTVAAANVSGVSAVGRVRDEIIAVQGKETIAYG